jgi:hypothetical protein
MVATFDEPDSSHVKDFWLRVSHAAGYTGSGGVKSLSGWITAFCFWDETGRKIRQYSDEELQGHFSAPLEERKRLTLSGVKFPLIPYKDIPKSVVTVPVTVRDLGAKCEYRTTMIAGSMGMSVTEQGSTMQPISGWWMLEDSSKPLRLTDQIKRSDVDLLTEPSESSDELSWINTGHASC